MSINKFNAERYHDPTAYEALSTIEQEEREQRTFRPIVFLFPVCGRYREQCQSRSEILSLRGRNGLHPIRAASVIPAILG